MIDLYWAMISLGICAAINWALGIYDKIGIEQLTWDWKTFVRGMAKIFIVVGSLIGLGYVWYFSNFDLSGIGWEPMTLVTSGAIYYAAKSFKRIAEIIHGKQVNELPEDLYDDVVFDVNPEGAIIPDDTETSESANVE